MKNPRCFATGYTSTDLTAITPAVERSRNQRGDVCPFPKAAQALKDKPLTPLSSDLKELGTNMAERIKRDFNCVGLDYNAFYPGETRLEALENLLNVPEQPDEYQVFFYHSDHLGSSSFITDINGDATQHLQYACTEPVECVPFGEDFVHQQNTAAYYTPYTFSGKERDLETNLSYFGARYYEAGLSIWLSVDPMAYRGPHLSPYNYCFNNPIWYRDPDGKWPTPETVWDVINIAMGVGSFATNVSVGNYWGAALDATGIAYDAFATSVPILPAGGSTAIGIYRLSNLTKKTLGAVDAAKNMFDGNKNFQSLNKALKRAYNSVLKETDIQTIQGAIKEKLGIPLEVLKKEAKDGKFDHTTKVEQGIRSMETAVAEIDKVLGAGALSKKEINVLKNTRDLLIERSNKLQEILKTADRLSETL